MLRSARAFPCLAALAVCAAPATVPAAESYDSCTAFITALPAVIGTQGTWCMNKDLSTTMQSGAAITVSANNVTIDCNGFKLGGLGAGANTATYGIYATGRGNTTIRGCAIRGFRYGISLNSGIGGHLIEDNRVEASTVVGIAVYGDNVRIRRNHVLDTGGSTLYPDTAGIGIVASGSGAIEDNRIAGVVGGSSGDGDAYGLFVSLTDSTVSRNQIAGLASPYTARPIEMYGSERTIVRDNDMTGPESWNDYAISCQNPSVALRGNTVGGYVYFSTELCDLGPDNHHF